MEKPCFAGDYGVIPTAFLQLQSITNATELLWSKDWERLLRLCGEEERMIDTRASDYERFAALCRAYPKLTGHPMKQYLQAFLKAHFPALPEPSPDTCEHLWREIANALAERDCTPRDFLCRTPMFCLVSEPTSCALPSHLRPLPDAEMLLHTSARTYRDWSTYIENLLEAFLQKGARAVRILLDSSYTFVLPDVYHVEKALSRVGGVGERNLLLSQLFRELCAACRKYTVELFIEADCAPAEAVALVRYAQKSVGLPILSWCAQGDTAAALIAFQSDAARETITRSLRTRDALTEEALRQTITEEAQRYPLGCMRFLTAQDLRFSTFEQERVWKVLQKSF